MGKICKDYVKYDIGSKITIANENYKVVEKLEFFDEVTDIIVESSDGERKYLSDLIILEYLDSMFD